MNSSLQHAVIWIVTIIICLSTGRAKEAPAIAVLADGALDSDVAAMASALEVGLSQDEAIRLLERGQIDRVLAEQQLSAAGLADHDSIIKAGQLLRAEALVLLTVEKELAQTQPPKSRLVRVRVAETARGLRLWEGYEALEPSQVGAAAERIAERVRAAVGKISQLGGPVIPVGIVDIHRVQLAERYEPLARVLPGLLSVRLGKEPRIVMLERESLGTLLRERQLTEGPDVAFWNSAVLIDGYLQPSVDKGIEMSLRLRRATGAELSAFQVPVDPNGLSGAIDNAAAHALKAVLDGSPAGRWDPAREADEFFSQGVLLLVHARRSAARTCLEAAHALQPDNIEHTGALFSASLPLRRTSSQPGEPADTSACTELELAELASLLTRQMRDAYETGVLPARDKQFDYGSLSLHNYFGQAISVATDEVRLINRRSRRIWFETYERIQAPRLSQIDDPTMRARSRVQLAWASSDDPEEVMAALRERLNQVILPPEMGGVFTSNDSRCLSCEQELYMSTHTRLRQLEETNLSGCAERFSALWDAYVKELAQSRDPLVKFYACAAEVFWLRDDKDHASAAEYCRRAADILLNELHSPNEPFNDRSKERTRRTMTDCLSLASPGLDADETAGLWERIYTPLIDAADAYNLALWNPGRQAGPYEKPEALERYRKLLVRIDEVYAGSDDDPQITRARAVLKDSLRWMQPRGSEPRPSMDVRKPHVTMLLRRGDWPQEKYAPRADPQFSSGTDWVQAVMRDDTLWIGFFFLRSSLPKPSSMAVVSLDLSHRQVRSVWWIALPYPHPLTGLVVHSDRVYAAVPEIGIVVVPGDGVSAREIVEEPNVLTEANGLPSRGVLSIADAGNRLWVAYGRLPSGRGERESGLGLYDPASKTWEPIFCSSKRDNPPFAGGRPYVLSRLALAGDKLFFFTDGTRFPGAGPCVDGLCEMDTNTGGLKCFGLGGIGEKGHVISGRKPWLFADPYSLTEFDPDTGRTRLVMGEPWWLKRYPESATIKRMEFDRVGGIEESSNRQFTFGPSVFGCVDLSAAAIHGNRIWTGFGESQVLIVPVPGARGDVVTLNNTLLDGAEVIRFVSTPYGLVGIGNGTAGLIETSDFEVTQSRRE